MKKKRIPLFSGYRRRREEAKREEVQKKIVSDLEKTMRLQRQRVIGTRETKKPETENKTEE